MKKTLSINVHSFIDVITNSSTEIFVCNTDKTIDAVRSILEDILEASLGEDNNAVYSDIFREPFIYTRKMYLVAMNSKFSYKYECKENIGKIMIMGSDDNIIPYRIWNLIDNVFNAHHEHLG